MTITMIFRRLSRGRRTLALTVRRATTLTVTRAAMLLAVMLLTMTAQTAWAQDDPSLPEPDGEGNVTLEGPRYSVTSNVTISGNITANNPVTLTISSGATLTVQGMGQIQMQMGTIEVQGTISGQECVIDVNTLNMTGGSVIVQGLIFRSGTIQNATIEAYNVGMTGIIDKISITGSTIVSNVINADNVTFTGSNVTVNSSLQLLGEVVFDASNPGVSINVAEYDNNGGSLTISNGSLKDGDGNIYTGAIADPSALNGKTLTYYNPSSTITVSLNAQGGSGGTTSVTPTAGSDMPAITPPTRTGYTFGGYYTETNGGGTQYYNADGTSAHVCELTGTVTLYAKWTANTYTVTLNRQGGSGQESVTAEYGSAMPTLNPVPSRTLCEFFGYYTETNGGGVKYYNADGTSARAWGIDANTTLYAYWKKSLANADITIEIPAQTYNGNELTPVVTVKDNGSVVSEEHYTIILPDGGCTNAGDYTISIVAKEESTLYVDGIGATFTINRRTVTLISATDCKTYDGTPLTTNGVTVSGDGFAEGEGATYDVTGTITDAGSTENTFTYTLNDGTNAANYDITKVEGTLTITKAASSVTVAPTAQSLVYNGSEQTLINAGTASGGTMYYSLDNNTWSTALPAATEAGAYTVYYKVEGDGNHDNTDAASIMAYIDYTITYDLDGGSVASANPTRYNETTATFTLTNPTRTGYDFTGWTGTGLDAATTTVTINNGSMGNRSYTATWTENVLELTDASDNTDAIETAATTGKTYNRVTLSGRTLYKDGAWNTLCLPFDVTDAQMAETTHPLYGATIMELDVEDKYNDGGVLDNTNGTHQTGFDATDGTLYLYFKEATSIEAGKPYIVKWDSGDDLVSPVFSGVTISNVSAATVEAKNSGLNTVQFIGTYSPVALVNGDQSNLFIGTSIDNKDTDDPNDDETVSTLYYPNVDGYYLNACRGYFHVDLTGAANIREFKLNFGDDEASSIDNGQLTIDNLAGAWYTIDGRKLDGVGAGTGPARLPKGIYIHGGKKVVVK